MPRPYPTLDLESTEPLDPPSDTTPDYLSLEALIASVSVKPGRVAKDARRDPRSVGTDYITTTNEAFHASFIYSRYVYRETVSTCKCASVFHEPEGLFLEQKHSKTNARKEVKVDSVVPHYAALPRRIIRTARTIPFCAHCIAGFTED